MTVIVNPAPALSGLNFGQLKAAIANRLGRNNLTAIIPDFVTLGEARIYYGFRDIEVSVSPLRIQAMIGLETASLAALPDNYLEMVRFSVPGTNGTRTLDYATPEQFAAMRGTGNCAKHFTLQDGGIAVEGGTPAIFTMSYYKRFPSLVADADTNWLLTNHPAIYLYSALMEAYAHIKDDARIPQATRMYAAAVNGLMESDNNARHSGSVLTIPSAR